MIAVSIDYVKVVIGCLMLYKVLRYLCHHIVGLMDPVHFRLSGLNLHPELLLPVVKQNNKLRLH